MKATTTTDIIPNSTLFAVAEALTPIRFSTVMMPAISNAHTTKGTWCT